MRYRLDVVSPSVTEVVRNAGGWLVDRVMAGWDVTVLIAGADVDVRPLQILGVAIGDLETAVQMWEGRPHRRPWRWRPICSSATPGCAKAYSGRSTRA